MILCVTLNACLDKTLTVPSWNPGDLVRGTSVREVVGGKGNNVARALKRLGRAPRPVTFLGGAVGDRCVELMRRDDGLEPLIVEAEASTREILTVLTAGSTEQTAFFDPDPAIRPDEADVLVAEVEKALDAGCVEAVALSGSSPSPSTHGTFSELISLARARRVPVFLDTYGPALEAIWGFWPSVIQVNRKEAAGLLRKPAPTDADVLGLLEDWRRHGVTLGLVTDGPNPVLIRSRDAQYRAIPPAIEVVNPIGAGDSLLAGLVDAWLSGSETEAIIRRGLGCATANAMVWDAGAVDPEVVQAQAEAVEIQTL